ncbi:MAG: DNA gyrase C-terminal beta-propeller domain-containing protein, partial [bacterium]|nr:DNA gyrase C-terminal beta-propeller domain-containing protein [bacterium]
EIEFDAEEYVQHENVHVIVTKDGWLKRIRETNDPASTRIREGDSLFFVQASSTRNSLALFTNHGNAFVVKIHELSQTTGYGEPVQKLFRFQDGENVIQALVLDRGLDPEKLGQLVFYTARGFGYRFSLSGLSDTKKTGRKLVKVSEGDELAGLFYLQNEIVFFISAAGYAVTYLATEVPELSGAGKGVILQKIPSDDSLVAGCSVSRSSSVSILASDNEEKSISIRSLTLGSRAKRGNKLIKRGLPVTGIKI